MQGKVNFPSPHFDLISLNAKEFIKCCLSVDKLKRLTAKQALTHPWIKTHLKASVSLSINKLEKVYELMSYDFEELSFFSPNTERIEETTFSKA